jgi:hypothetical protein
MQTYCPKHKNYVLCTLLTYISHLAIACEAFRLCEQVCKWQQNEKREVGEKKNMIPQT